MSFEQPRTQTYGSRRLHVFVCFSVGLLFAGSATAQEVRVYTPKPGDTERSNIMDAIRLAHCPDTVWKVQYIRVAKKSQRALALADVSDSTRTTECGGLFFLRGLNSQWRVISLVGAGGGSTDCSEAKRIHGEIVSEIDEFGAPRKILPDNFWHSYDEAKAGDSDDGCSVAERH